tara:strand:+ start:1017 stop:1328 length:312 start_codon:yes stop_codon:yes gene_type:complete
MTYETLRTLLQETFPTVPVTEQESHHILAEVLDYISIEINPTVIDGAVEHPIKSGTFQVGVFYYSMVPSKSWTGEDELREQLIAVRQELFRRVFVLSTYLEDQ